MADRRLVPGVKKALAKAALGKDPLSVKDQRMLHRMNLLNPSTGALTTKAVRYIASHGLDFGEGAMARAHLNQQLDIVLREIPAIFETAYKAGVEQGQRARVHSPAACDKAFSELEIDKFINRINEGRQL